MRKIEKRYYEAVDVNEKLLNENAAMFSRIEELENENIRLRYELEELRKTLRVIRQTIDCNRRILNCFDEW